MAGSSPKNFKMLKLKGLTLHPATALIPPAPPTERSDSIDSTPIGVFENHVLTGHEQFKRAKKRKIDAIPGIRLKLASDADIEMYVLDHALKSQYLTDDQRAALAVEYAEKLSKQMRRARAKNAAAVRHGAACRPTGANKQDSRAEACKRFHIQTKRFRQVKRLRAQHDDLYREVRVGSMGLKAARQAASREKVAKLETERTAAAPATAATDIILGDARKIIPTLPDDHFTALITDPPYGINFRQEWREGSEIEIVGDKDARVAVELFRTVLTTAGPKLRRDAFLLSFVPAKHESEFRAVVVSLGWSIIGHLIWVKNSRVLFPQLNIASSHERMILAVRGGARLRKPILDVFGHGKTHASRHPCEKPVALLSELIEAITVEGEAVLDPFAGSGSTVLAAKKMRRIAVGIEIVERWHAEAVSRGNHVVHAAKTRRSARPENQK